MTRIVILGAGPTGLGAAYRLQELGHEDWDLYEQHDYIGGLAASFTDDKGFTYDIGGHVMFCHYKYYDRLFDKLMGDDCTEHHARELGLDVRQVRAVPVPEQHPHLPKRGGARVPARADRGAAGAASCIGRTSRS